MTITRSRDRKPSSAKSSPPRPGRDPAPPQAAPEPKPKPTVVAPAPAPASEPPKSTPAVGPGTPTVQRRMQLPEIPLTRADVPEGTQVHLGRLKHGICPWRGTPYVALHVKGLGEFGWRHTWGLNPDAVTYQHLQDSPVRKAVWVALDLGSERARKANEFVFQRSVELKVAWRTIALKTKEAPEENP
jgi:hypothetical protein